jgi:hypothetical protein
MIEQHSGSRVSEHTRMGFDNRVHLFDCRLKLGPFGNSEAPLAGMCRRRIAEITRGFAQTPPFGTIICTLSSLTT